jgi:hypothetical protein
MPSEISIQQNPLHQVEGRGAQLQQHFPYFSGFQLGRDTKLVHEAILFQHLLLPIILTLSHVPVR